MAEASLRTAAVLPDLSCGNSALNFAFKLAQSTFFLDTRTQTIAKESIGILQDITAYIFGFQSILV
jgi:hypothetical protein